MCGLTCQVTGAREAAEGPPRRVRVDRRVRPLRNWVQKGGPHGS